MKEVRLKLGKLFRVIYRLKILPRWVIIGIDLLLIGFCTFLGYLLRFNFFLPEMLSHNFYRGVLVTMVSAYLCILITSSYKGIVRHTGLQDSVRIIYMLALTLVFINVLNIGCNFFTGLNLIPYSVVLISFLASFLFLFNYRLLVKYIFSFHNSRLLKNSNVLIYGAGKTGITTKQVIESSRTSRIVGFLENDEHKIGKVLNGSKIFPATLATLERLMSEHEVDDIIITVKTLSAEVKNKIIDICLKNQVKVWMVPPVEKWVRGELSLNQIKEIKIEDLLEREAIMLEDENLVHQLKGKRVCITGAAGSIGSEIVRQVILYNPERVILIDQAESPLFEAERQARLIKANEGQIFAYIADITNGPRMEAIFRDHRPELVFHAAAYKHVPMMETNPAEAITCNILGTKILADLSMAYKVDRFVMVSTDKAVNPTNVMGCSKRIAEIYVQSLNNHHERLGLQHTAFITTRFGNVLGSNGSVIPLFKQQIESGGPLTVTHPEITRYFMTIPEACRLVLEAGAMGRGGEIFIFDMGHSVRIYDLAKKMIELSGFKPGIDIEIVFTGLREGEKLYEELLSKKENAIKTHHEKIMIAKVDEYSYDKIEQYINLFYDLVNDRNELKMVALMKELVPEFKSNYSRFEVLDEKMSARSV